MSFFKTLTNAKPAVMTVSNLVLILKAALDANVIPDLCCKGTEKAVKVL